MSHKLTYIDISLPAQHDTIHFPIKMILPKQRLNGIYRYLAESSRANSSKNSRGAQFTKEGIKWWLIYGPPRTGTSYMLSAVGQASKRIIGDWLIGNILTLVGDLDHVGFDWPRAFRDISSNILDNARAGRGKQLDLAFKQAGPTLLAAYPGLVKMWGEPQRKIFCYREPAGYIASAKEKFPEWTLERICDEYITSFRIYGALGGDVFEYHPLLSTEDYEHFLLPLDLKGNIKPFHFKGKYNIGDVPGEMRDVFNDVKALQFVRHQDLQV